MRTIRFKFRLSPILLSVTLGVMLCLSSLAASSEYNLLSPDGKIKVDITCTESALSYSLTWKGRELLKPSPLSLFPNPRYKVLSTKTASIDKRWDSVWGQFSEVHDRCEELTLTLDISGVRVDLVCRVYNDGLGFRFAVPEQGGIACGSDLPAKIGIDAQKVWLGMRCRTCFPQGACACYPRGT